MLKYEKEKENTSRYPMDQETDPGRRKKRLERAAKVAAEKHKKTYRDALTKFGLELDAKAVSYTHLTLPTNSLV